MEIKMDDVMKEIVEKMEAEGTPTIKLAALFIKEPLSLEGLLMLDDMSPMTIDQVYKEFTCDIREDVNATRILDKLKGFGMINIKDNIVSITDRGHSIANKLRTKMNSVQEGGSNLCDMKHGCIYNVEN
jgi:predicted transcriptional regulator